MQAVSISLVSDDRGGFKLVRFRADGGPSLYSRETTFTSIGGGSVSGIVGCIPSRRGTSLDEFAEDYAKRTVHEIDKLVMAFCTPLGGTVDEALVKHVYSKARSICVDGALVKVAQYLRATKMPNVVLICGIQATWHASQ